MKKTFTILLSSICLITVAQTQLSNGGFENWENVGSSTEEPTDFNSNKTGSSVASIGPQTCFRDGSIKRSGSYALRLENKSYFGTVVNGSATTGVVNAPSTNKADGYIGTINYSTASDIRRLAFTGRPDSIVGYYQYTSGGTGEQGKITAILHNNNYFDPETPTTYHADPTADKIARATFLTPTGSQSNWVRFSAPFVYTSSGTPAYIMINMTPSNDQLTTFAGSKIWFDDVSFVYNPVNVKENSFDKNAQIYSYEKILYVEFTDKNNEQSVLEIFDITGKVVSTHVISNNTNNSVNLSVLNSGLYLYKLNYRSQTKFGKVFIH